MIENERAFRSLPVPRLLAGLIVPGMFGMLFSSLYVVADGIFVGHCLGSCALAAVNLVFPFLAVTYAVGDMIAIGSSVRISIALGKKHKKTADRFFSASLLWIFFLNILFQIVALCWFSDLLHYFVRDSELEELASRYMIVYAYTLPITAQLFSLDNYLRICGRIRFCMTVNICVSCLNVFLDWLLICCFRGGIEMAAWASAGSMCLGTAVSLYPFVFRKVSLHFTFPHLRQQELWAIVYNGSSEFLNKISFSGVSILFNSLLLKYGGGTAVAAYAVVLYLDNILFSVVNGILDAVQPAVSYNYGAGEWLRLRQILKQSCVILFAVALILVTVGYLFPETLIGIFIRGEDQTVFQEACPALKFYLPGCLWNWFNSAAGAFATHLDRPGESLLIMSLRAVIFPLLLAGLLPLLFRTAGIYLISASGGLLTFFGALFIWRRMYSGIRQMERIVRRTGGVPF